MKRTKTTYEESLPIYYSDKRELREQLNFINFNLNKSCQRRKQQTDKKFVK